MTQLDVTRIRAVARKEVRDYRRKRSIVVTMAVFPIIFLIEPVVSITKSTSAWCTSFDRLSTASFANGTR